MPSATSTDITFGGFGFDLQAALSTGKFSLLAYSGDLLHLPGMDGLPAVIDCSSVVAGNTQPILRDHDPERPVGHGVPVVERGQLSVEHGAFSHDNEDVTEIRSAASKGFTWQCSVGGRIGNKRLIGRGQSVRVNGRVFTGPLYVISSFRWRETSFCVLGRDQAAPSARVAASLNNREQSMLYSHIDQSSVLQASFLIHGGVSPHAVAADLVSRGLTNADDIVHEAESAQHRNATLSTLMIDFIEASGPAISATGTTTKRCFSSVVISPRALASANSADYRRL